MLNGPEIISKFLGESEKNLRLVCFSLQCLYNASVNVCKHCVKILKNISMNFALSIICTK